MTLMLMFFIKRTLFYGFKKWKNKVFQINQEVQIIKNKFNIYKKHRFSLLLKNKIKEVQIKIKGVV